MENKIQDYLKSEQFVGLDRFLIVQRRLDGYLAAIVDHKPSTSRLYCWSAGRLPDFYLKLNPTLSVSQTVHFFPRTYKCLAQLIDIHLL